MSLPVLHVERKVSLNLMKTWPGLNTHLAIMKPLLSVSSCLSMGKLPPKSFSNDSVLCLRPSVFNMLVRVVASRLNDHAREISNRDGFYKLAWWPREPCWNPVLTTGPYFTPT